MKTKAFIDNYKGHQIFAVWKVDEAGNKTGKAPVVSLGFRKANGIAKHFEEFKKFLQMQNEKNDSKEEQSVEVPTDLKDLF